MNSAYFQFQSDLASSENWGEVDQNSLYTLLNSIPTDIPRNATEFDEEIRNLIIALYSDKKGSDNIDARSARSVIEEAKDDGDEKLRAGYIKEPFHDAWQNHANHADEANNEDSNSGTAMYTQSVPTDDTNDYKCVKDDKPEVDKLSSVDEGIDNKINILHRHLPSELVIDRCSLHSSPSAKEVWEKLQYVNANSTNVMDCDGPAECSSHSDLPIIEEGGLEFSEGKEKFQESLDELDDGKMARILTSVTSWLSLISNESNPIETMASPKFLDTGPSAFNLLSLDDLKANAGDVMIGFDERKTCEGNISLHNVDQIIEGCAMGERGVMDSLVVRPHSLSSISEERDTQTWELTDNVNDHVSSNMNSIFTLESWLDSGIASFSTFDKIHDDDDYDHGGSSSGGGEAVPVNENCQEISGGDRSVVPCLKSEKTPEETGPPSHSDEKEDASRTEKIKNCFEIMLGDLEVRLNSPDALKVGRDCNNGQIVDVNRTVQNQMHSICNEYASLMTENVNMKKNIWDLEERLHVMKKNMELELCEKNKVGNEKEKMLMQTRKLEDQLEILESIVKERQSCLNNAVEKTRDAEMKCISLTKKCEEMEETICKKTSEFESAKNELEKNGDLYKEVLKEKNKYESDSKLISEAFKKLKLSNSWLEFQLKTLSDSRAKMEVKYEEVKTEVEEKRNELLSLKNENMNLSSKLINMNFNSTKEKEDLFDTMGTIEQRILQSQIDYNELENKYELIGVALKEKDKVIRIHGEKIKELLIILNDAELLEANLKSEITDKDTTIISLKESVSGKECQVADLESALNNLKADHSTIHDKFAELTKDFLRMKSLTRDKDVDIRNLQNEKDDITKQLSHARTEKMEFEKAAHHLRSDMVKVDRIFQVMKKNLVAKSSMLQNIEEKKLELLAEMKQLQEYVLRQDEEQSELRECSRLKTENLQELSGKKDALENEVNCMSVKCQRLENESRAILVEKQGIRKEFEDMKKQWNEDERKLNEFIVLQKQKQEALLEVNKETNVKLSHLHLKNSNILEEAENTTTQFEREIVKLRSKESKLAAKLKKRQDEWRIKEQNYKSSILSLVGKLKEESVARQHFERCLLEKAEVLEKEKEEKHFMNSKIVEMKEQVGRLKQEKGMVRNDVISIRSMNGELLSFMKTFVDKIKQSMNESGNDIKELNIEKERLKSELNRSEKLVQLLETQKNADQKKNDELENKIKADRDNFLNLKIDLVKTQNDQDRNAAIIKKLEIESQKLQEEYDELKDRTKNTDSLNESLQSTIKQQDIEISRLRDDLLGKDKEINRQMNSLEELSKLNAKHSEEKIDQERRHAETQGIIFDLENQLSIERSHGRVLEDQVNNAKWQLKQSVLDANAKDAELTSCKQQHEIELKNALSMLNVVKAEFLSLRSELIDVRKVKQRLQMKLSDSNKCLRMKSNEYDILRDEVVKRNKDLFKLKTEMEGSRSSALRETVDFVVKKAIIIVKSRPEDEAVVKDKNNHQHSLEFVKNYMVKLRNEMDALQSQMKSQMKHLETSKNKFRNFDESLESLHIACNRLEERANQIATDGKTL
eukprot:gene14421-15928_t